MQNQFRGHTIHVSNLKIHIKSHAAIIYAVDEFLIKTELLNQLAAIRITFSILITPGC